MPRHQGFRPSSWAVGWRASPRTTRRPTRSRGSASTAYRARPTSTRSRRCSPPTAPRPRSNWPTWAIPRSAPCSPGVANVPCVTRHQPASSAMPVRGRQRVQPRRAEEVLEPSPGHAASSSAAVWTGRPRRWGRSAYVRRHRAVRRRRDRPRASPPRYPVRAAVGPARPGPARLGSARSGSVRPGSPTPRPEVGVARAAVRAVSRASDERCPAHQMMMRSLALPGSAEPTASLAHLWKRPLADWTRRRRQAPPCLGMAPPPGTLADQVSRSAPPR
jgi:hypothetical protein